jgi:nanoRNase/pAp phosphatase (c-di-AMP/oligoRNAs hydrolase)
LRSSIHNVHQIAEKYNGGGHEKASGAVINTKAQINEIVEFADKISK